MSIDLKEYNVPQLLMLYAGILDELSDRNVIRSSNAPLGDYCEYLFCQALGWKQENNSKAGYDAMCEQGIRYQIKSRRPTTKNKSRQLSFIRRLPEKHFEFLAACLFNEDFSIHRAAIIPHHLIEPRSRYSSHGNGWLFHLEDDIWELPGVEDVTDKIKKAATEL